MSGNPLVSVLIPSCNHENYIKETIKSVINQEYQNIELIIIDDGSIDLTFEKIKEAEEICKKRFSNFIYKTRENKGTAYTLGELTDLSKGEFVTFLASDDLIKPDLIEKAVFFLKNNPNYSLFVGNSEFIDSKGQICYWDKNQNLVYNKSKAKYLTHKDYLQNGRISFNSDRFGEYETLYYKNYIPNGCVIRKNIFEKIEKFTPLAPLEDWFLVLQIAKYSKMKYFDEILFSYRCHNFNTMKNVEKVKEMEEKTAKFEEEILKKIDLNEVSKSTIKTIKNGVVVKKIGLPFLFELEIIKKGGKKIKQIKLFKIKIFRFK